MANVKISELPSASAITDNDVFVVNAASDNTTKKASVRGTMFKQGYTLWVPPDGITVTVEGVAVNSLKITTRKGGFMFGMYQTLRNVVFTNTTSSDVNLRFSIKQPDETNAFNCGYSAMGYAYIGGNAHLIHSGLSGAYTTVDYVFENGATPDVFTVPANGSKTWIYCEILLNGLSTTFNKEN